MSGLQKLRDLARCVRELCSRAWENSSSFHSRYPTPKAHEGRDRPARDKWDAEDKSPLEALVPALSLLPFVPRTSLVQQGDASDTAPPPPFLPPALRPLSRLTLASFPMSSMNNNIYTPFCSKASGISTVNKDSPQPLSLSHWQPPTPANAACQPACCVPASVPAGGACLPALRASQYSVPASVPASLYQQDQLAFRLLYNSLTSSLPEVIIQVILLIHCPR